MVGTSVTVVLIGAETWQRDYVRYEIQHSHDEGKGLLGVRISDLKDQWGRTDMWGSSPFEVLWAHGLMGSQPFSQLYPVYDWVWENGYQNIGRWIEEAAVRAGR